MAAWWNRSDYSDKKGEQQSWSYEEPSTTTKSHPWSATGFNSKGDYKKATWKDWHPEESEDELRSPQGKKKQELHLPADFCSDSKCLDNRELFGRKFYRQVQLTNWSQKHGLAGREICDLKLHELAYGGWNNFYLRHLSTGAFTTIVFCRKINESMLASALLPVAAIRESKRRWDIDSLARECGKRHPEFVPSSAASSRGEEPSKEIHTLVNFLIAQLEPFSNEDKDQQIRMLEAKLAEKGKPTSPPLPPGNLPVADSANMAQPSKRRRIAVKSDLTKHLFDMNIGVHDRPLASSAPSSHSAATVKKWWTGLKVKNLEGLQNVQARADSILASLSEEQKTQLKDRVCSLGLPFAVAAKCKDLEALRIILAALYMLDI